MQKADTKMAPNGQELSSQDPTQPTSSETLVTKHEDNDGSESGLEQEEDQDTWEQPGNPNPVDQTGERETTAAQDMEECEEEGEILLSDEDQGTKKPGNDNDSIPLPIASSAQPQTEHRDEATDRTLGQPEDSVQCSPAT